MVTLHEDRLEEPLHWKQPRKVFVCSMGDLFHARVPFEFITKVWEVMELARQHTFLVLTKRPQRMKEFLEGLNKVLPNVWLGVSAEMQPQFDRRVGILRQIPASLHFVSCEPLLGPIDAGDLLCCRSCITGKHNCRSCFYAPPNWIIVGGESGPRARPMNLNWSRRLLHQCRAAGTLFFMKQLGSAYARQHGLNNDPKGSKWENLPPDLRVRQEPSPPSDVAQLREARWWQASFL